MGEELERDPMCCEKMLRSMAKACHVFIGINYEHKLWILETLKLIPTPVPDEPVVTYSKLLSRLVETNRDLGNYDEAIQYGRQNLKNCQNRPKDFPPLNQGWIRCHLARVLYMQGNLEESEVLIQEAIEIFGAVDDHFSQSFSYDVLGQIRMKRSVMTRLWI